MMSYKVEQIRSFLNSNQEEIFTVAEIKEKTGYDFTPDSLKLRRWLGGNWVCRDSKQRIYMFGNPETIKVFVAEIEGIENEA